MNGLAVVRWTIDTGGYKIHSTVDQVLYNVFDRPFFNSGAIILMHDDHTDMQALPLIIKGIRARGYATGVDG
ncbi:MAG TPA: hypothetical protein VF337_00115 [Candidatus Limnocylindrales bacterium]